MSSDDIKPHTNFHYLSHFSLINQLNHYMTENNQLKLKGLNDAHKIAHTLTHLDEYWSLVMAMSENDVPCVQHILVWQILTTLEDAIAGTGDDLDLATLLMYALNHRLGLPSLHTLQAHLIFTSITPTIGSISPDQFDANINALIITPHTNLVVLLQGHSERASHYRPANCVIGLCHSHSNLIDPMLHTYDSTLRIATKLNEGEVHLGKEMSVMDIHAFGDDNLFPILAAPTCKMENVATMMEILTMARDWWRATGAEACFGAGHCLFVKMELPKMSKLYSTLSCMPGLNLATGDDEITLDFDYKHIFKC
ncbi:uncharacterized protein BJ212DRAFT_1445215 [Suillus subaureus]|uniref:Uncharacterized protein n=1 Tax=Suillus subaureus TaxID=48587 RepID=A0A9P7JGQ6_9AGAM|nr:uncharacterized protein BJ212DRAFT_1445215 [Suillus subaureus]KAG1821708.1 hypothetical protein BJ212DRAFT_1445215 [Suillus subaureus]